MAMWMFFSWARGAPARMGIYATLASAAIGLLLALFQVQDWKMPRLLAILLIVFLVGMFGVAAMAIVYEGIRGILRAREHRTTSASWVASEEPGLLDYPADAVRANKRFTKELSKLNRDTARVGRKLERHGKRMAKSADKSAETKQRLGNRSARAINRSAVFVEKRLELLDALVKDILRNTKGQIASLTLQNDEVAIFKEFSEVLKSGHQTTEDTIASVSGYRDSVRDIESQNLSRAIRIASGRLGVALDGVLKTLKKFDSGSLENAHALDRKIAEAEGRSSLPRDRASNRLPNQSSAARGVSGLSRRTRRAHGRTR